MTPPRLGIAALAACLCGLALLVAAPGQAAGECDNLMVCIPVAGPWVGIPAPSAGGRYPRATWQLKCPEGVVAGLDARLSDRAIDVGFFGLLGSPVNPGITTTVAVVFEAMYTGAGRRSTSFRPFIGCIPTAGGVRTPTAVTAFKPDRATMTRVKALRLVPGRLARATHGCGPGERLVSYSTAAGLYMRRPPTTAQLAAVRIARSVRRGRIVVSASRRGLPREIRAEVQIHALCALGERR